MACFGLKEFLEGKNNELSPHSKIPPFFLQSSFNQKSPDLIGSPDRGTEQSKSACVICDVG
jgi:hypothetical protein